MSTRSLPESFPLTARPRRPRAAAVAAALKAVGYLRRSTDRQEQSIADQQRAIQRHCADSGLELLRCYVDDAVSGTSVYGRRAFQDMVKAALQPCCDFRHVVVYDLKRLGRGDNDEAGFYRHLLRIHGVEIRYAAEDFRGDGTDDLLRPVKQWQAREESRALARVSIRGLLSRCITGCWVGGVPPFGFDLRYQSRTGLFLCRVRYNRDATKTVMDDASRPLRTLERRESLAVSRSDRCRLVLGDSERVETVRRIYRMYLDEDMGYKRIADALNRARIPTARDCEWAAHYSGQWSMIAVMGVLTHPAYCGDMVWNRRTDARFFRIRDGAAAERPYAGVRRMESNDRAQWIMTPNAHPAIISREVWDQSQARVAARRRPRQLRLAA